MSFDLETADHPEGLRRVAIDPISRVEGHGKVTLLLDADGKVRQARLHIVEFRGFEGFIRGRPYWEVPVMVQRLCGICPVSHHLAASKAFDMVVGARQLTPTADKLRRLMHLGQVMQSHALHFFHLAAPDLLFGFDAEPQRRNLVGIAEQHPETARRGVLLRKYGQEIIRATSGKRVHGTGAVPGGVNRHLDAADHAQLQHEWPSMLQMAREAVHLARRLFDADPARHACFGTVDAAQMSLVRADGALELYDGLLRVRDADGHQRVAAHEPQDYLALIEEEVRPWTYMKFPYLRELGPQRGWYQVGPLARVQNCDLIDTELAEAERRDFVQAFGGRPTHAPLAFHWARMVEVLHTVEAIGVLLGDADLLAGERMAGDPGAAPRDADGQRIAIGVIEAPRGTLIHDYRVGDDDLVTRCNLIVSTTHNNQAMNESLRQVAREHFDGREVDEGLLNHVEVAIRAYDPCLSCATHALGRMPLRLECVDADGALVSALGRDADGGLRRVDSTTPG